MSGSVSTQCPHCRAILKLKTRKVIGRKAPCRECGKPFVLKPLPESQQNNFDEGRILEEGYEDYNVDTYRSARPAPRRNSTTTSTGWQTQALIGGSIGGVAVLLIGLVIWFGNRGNREQPGRVQPGEDPTNSARAGAPGSVPNGVLNPVTNQPPVQPAGQIPSIEESRAFAESIEQTVNSRNVRNFSAMFDWDALIARAMDGLAGSASTHSEMIAGLKDSLGSNTFANEIIRSRDRGEIYHLVRVHEQDGARRALFRMRANDTINYHDLVLSKRPDGSIKITDMYVFQASELASQTLRRMLIPIVANASRSILERFTEKENDFVKHLAQFAQLQQCVKTGRHQQFVQVYNTLPASLQNEKVFLLMRLQNATLAKDDPEFLRSIRGLRTHYPNDSGTDFLSVDFYTRKGQYAEALRCLDRFALVVQDDAYMDYLRAQVHIDRGLVEQAILLIKQSLRAEPTLMEAHEALIAVLLALQKFSEAAAQIEQFEIRFPRIYGEFKRIPDYSKFLRSPEYREWKKLRR